MYLKFFNFNLNLITSNLIVGVCKIFSIFYLFLSIYISVLLVILLLLPRKCLLLQGVEFETDVFFYLPLHDLAIYICCFV